MAEEGSVAADKKPSLVESISKAAAVLGAVIAVGQAGTTWINGYWQAQTESTKKEKEVELAQIRGRSDLAENYIKLIIAKDTKQADRIMLLGVLSKLNGHPLQEWAKTRYDSIQESMVALNKAMDAQIEASQLKSEAERKQADLSADIARLNADEQLARANDDFDKIKEVQQKIREKSALLLTARATISVQSARLESGATVITRVEQGVTVAATNADLGEAIAALAGKVNANLLMKVFPASARANIEANVGYLASAMKEFRISDHRVAAAIIAEIVLETPNFDSYVEEQSSARSKDAPPSYSGRGYIGLTGRPNYEEMSARLGLGTRLVDNPDDAKNPEVAARIICAYYVDRLAIVIDALDRNQPAEVRRRVIRPRNLQAKEYTELYGKILALL